MGVLKVKVNDLGAMPFIDKDLTSSSQKRLAHFQPNSDCKLVGKRY